LACSQKTPVIFVIIYLKTIGYNAIVAPRDHVMTTKQMSFAGLDRAPVITGQRQPCLNTLGMQRSWYSDFHREPMLVPAL
jgi:hypothetical protein